MDQSIIDEHPEVQGYSGQQAANGSAPGVAPINTSGGNSIASKGSTSGHSSDSVGRPVASLDKKAADAPFAPATSGHLGADWIDNKLKTWLGIVVWTHGPHVASFVSM